MSSTRSSSAGGAAALRLFEVWYIATGELGTPPIGYVERVAGEPVDLALERRAAELFEELAELPVSEQEGHLASVTEVPLRERVAQLLEADRAEELRTVDAGGLVAAALAVSQALSSPQPLLAPGDLVGAYRVHRRVGVGGMAEVWAAEHLRLGTRHAIKVLLRPTPVVRARLLREGRTQGALAHQHILPVREVLELDDTAALVMPLVEGPSLRQLLDRRRLSEPEALALFGAMLAAVGHAHGARLVHRDLKPGNVLLGLRGERVHPYVADFGLVRDLAGTRHTADGVLMGTLAYAAPEQLVDAASADARSDLFSLGVVLVEMLTGTHPFAASSTSALLPRHERIPDLSGVPQRLHVLVRALLDPDPARRPGSCAEVAAVLGVVDGAALGGPLAEEVGAAARAAAPQGTWDTAIGPPNNLPPGRDRFVGREALLRELWQRVQARPRVLTLLGPAGVGKTRVAQELARGHAAHWSGGVVWVDLSDARDGDELRRATADALGVQLQAAADVQLGHTLRMLGPALVLWDNFEQLVEVGLPLLATWSEAAPAATFLVTSRRRLDLPGEQVVVVEPMSADAGTDLFIARAADVRSGFAPDAAQRATIRDLVALLDGLPLAIELAAARSHALSPAQIVRRLGQRFRLLSRDSTATASHHSSLRTALEWSWSLLGPAERAALAQLSVLAGGFTLEVAEAVVKLEDPDAWVDEVVARLFDRSLLVRLADLSDGTPRFGMLVSIAAFAGAELGDPDAVRTRLARYLAPLAGDVVQGGTFGILKARPAVELPTWEAAIGPGVPADLALVCALTVVNAYDAQGAHRVAESFLPGLFERRDWPPLHAAVLSCAEAIFDGRRTPTVDAVALRAQLEGDDSDAARRCRAVIRFLEARKLRAVDPRGAATTLEAAVDTLRPGVDDALATRLRCHLSAFWAGAGELDRAERLARQSLMQARAIGLGRLHGRALRVLGHTQYLRGDLEVSIATHRRCEAVYREVGELRGEIEAAHGRRAAQMVLASPSEMPDILAEYLEEAERLAAVGNWTAAYLNRGNAGIGYLQIERWEEGEALLQEALSQHLQLGFSGGVVSWSIALGTLYIDRGELDLALPHVQCAVDTSTASGADHAYARAALGLIHGLRGQWDAADAEFSAAIAFISGRGAPYHHAGILAYRGRVECERGQLARARATHAEMTALLADRPSSLMVVRVTAPFEERLQGLGALDRQDAPPERLLRTD